jgi:hypothetical protein
MKNITYLLLASFFVFFSCQPSEDEELLDQDNSVIANISGTIEFTGVGLPEGTGSQTWVLGDYSTLEICITKNLTLNPYNLKYTLTVDENDITAPILYFSSDFDRKIVPGDRYRLMTTIILDSDNQIIAGQTGGKVSLFNHQYNYGMGLGSELEITIANDGESVINGSSQLLNITGFFVQDANNLSTQAIGTFSIQIDGNNIIDTSLF